MTNTELLYTILGTTSLILILINYYGIKNYVEPIEKIEEKEHIPVKDCIYTEPEEIIVKPKRAYKKRTPKVVEAPVKKVRNTKKTKSVE